MQPLRVPRVRTICLEVIDGVAVLVNPDGLPRRGVLCLDVSKGAMRMKPSRPKLAHAAHRAR